MNQIDCIEFENICLQYFDSNNNQTEKFSSFGKKTETINIIINFA